MRLGEPSRTAFGAAAHRAAHQDLDGGRVFPDPFAWRILGAAPDQVLDRARERSRALRLFIAVRHRFAEDALAAAVSRGTAQLVVLGAGLDTFALRNPHEGLAVFEVDHPDTGAWKRQRLAEAGLDARRARYVAVDFETDDLVARLVAHGFDPSRPAFFMWLGVVPYLTRDAVVGTLQTLATIPGAEVVFDYPTPSVEGSESPERADLRRRTARAGEPILCELVPDDLTRLLHELGYDEVEDLGRAEILPRYFGVEPQPSGPGAGGHGGGGHVVRARRTLADGGALPH